MKTTSPRSPGFVLPGAAPAVPGKVPAPPDPRGEQFVPSTKKWRPQSQFDKQMSSLTAFIHRHDRHHTNILKNQDHGIGVVGTLQVRCKFNKSSGAKFFSSPFSTLKGLAIDATTARLILICSEMKREISQRGHRLALNHVNLYDVKTSFCPFETIPPVVDRPPTWTATHRSHPSVQLK